MSTRPKARVHLSRRRRPRRPLRRRRTPAPARDVRALAHRRRKPRASRRFTSIRATSAPCAARPAQIAVPRPPPAPVTTATRSVRSKLVVHRTPPEASACALTTVGTGWPASAAQQRSASRRRRFTSDASEYQAEWLVRSRFGALEQRVLGVRRLLRKHVQRGSGDGSGAKGVVQRCGVDQAPARDVHQQRSWLHRLEPLSVDEVVSLFCQRAVQ